MMTHPEPTGLTECQVQSFVEGGFEDGFVRIDGAFPTDLARQCRDEL